jgi:hypothetical protein
MEAKDLRSLHLVLVTANVVPSSPRLLTLMMEAMRSSETSIITRAARNNILQNDIFHFHFALFEISQRAEY